MNLDTKTRDFTLMENLKDQFERDNKKLFSENKQAEVDIGEMRAQLRSIEKDNKYTKRMNAELTQKKEMVTRQKLEAEHEKLITKSGVSALTREIEYLRKQTDAEKTNILNLIRDRDMMSKYIKKAEEENFKNKDELTKKQNEIAQWKESGSRKDENIANLLKQIYKLEKERDRFSHEASKANANLMQMVEEVKLK